MKPVFGVLCILMAHKGARGDTLDVQNSKKFDRELSPLLHSIFFETEVCRSICTV